MFPQLALAVAPSILDVATGASKKQSQAFGNYIGAMDKQQSGLSQIIKRIVSEAGTSPFGSAYYKTGMGKLNNQFRDNSKVIGQNVAATGATTEGSLGMLDSMNDAYFNAMMGLVGQAEVNRNNMLSRADALQMEYDALGVNKEAAKLGKAAQSTAAIGEFGKAISALGPTIDSYFKKV